MQENNMTYYDNLSVSSSPHLVTSLDTARTMQYVLLALAPAALASVIFFGLHPLVLIIACMASSAFFEWGYEKLLKKPETVRDCSALVTGAIIALNMPANFPVWMAIIGCFVAVVIVKCLYGGIGRNIANPAIVGRIVLLLSFTSQMTTWPLTNFQRIHADAVTGATPLGLLADGAVSEAPSLGAMFIGNIGGAMGETCVIAVLLGAAFLIWKKIISPVIPCVFVGTVFLFSLIYYAFAGGDHNALYMAFFHVFAGGVLFGAVFCATDYVTSPILKEAKIIYAVGCGLVTMIIRLFCAYPEGVSFAILFMNVMTPLIDRVVVNRYYGVTQREKEAKKKAKEEAAKAKEEAKKEVSA